MFPTDSLRCNPVQNRNISTDQCGIQHTQLWRIPPGRHSPLSDFASGRESALEAAVVQVKVTTSEINANLAYRATG